MCLVDGYFFIICPFEVTEQIHKQISMAMSASDGHSMRLFNPIL